MRRYFGEQSDYSHYRNDRSVNRYGREQGQPNQQSPSRFFNEPPPPFFNERNTGFRSDYQRTVFPRMLGYDGGHDGMSAGRQGQRFSPQLSGNSPSYERHFPGPSYRSPVPTYLPRPLPVFRDRPPPRLGLPELPGIAEPFGHSSGLQNVTGSHGNHGTDQNMTTARQNPSPGSSSYFHSTNQSRESTGTYGGDDPLIPEDSFRLNQLIGSSSPPLDPTYLNNSIQIQSQFGDSDRFCVQTSERPDIITMGISGSIEDPSQNSAASESDSCRNFLETDSASNASRSDPCPTMVDKNDVKKDAQPNNNNFGTDAECIKLPANEGPPSVTNALVSEKIADMTETEEFHTEGGDGSIASGDGDHIGDDSKNTTKDEADGNEDTCGEHVSSSSTEDETGKDSTEIGKNAEGLVEICSEDSVAKIDESDQIFAIGDAIDESSKLHSLHIEGNLQETYDVKISDIETKENESHLQDTMADPANDETEPWEGDHEENLQEMMEDFLKESKTVPKESETMANAVTESEIKSNEGGSQDSDHDTFDSFTMSYACGICNIEYQSKDEFENHLKMAHVDLQDSGISKDVVDGKGSDRESWTCSICKASFDNDSDLVNHVLSHENESDKDSPESRDSGIKSRKTQSNAVTESEIKSNEGESQDSDHDTFDSFTMSYACGICNIEYQSKDEFENHLKMAHVDLQDSGISKDVVDGKGSDRESWTCSICKASFDNDSDLVNHVLSHENESDKDSPESRDSGIKSRKRRMNLETKAKKRKEQRYSGRKAPQQATIFQEMENTEHVQTIAVRNEMIGEGCLKNKQRTSKHSRRTAEFRKSHCDTPPTTHRKSGNDLSEEITPDEIVRRVMPRRHDNRYGQATGELESPSKKQLSDGEMIQKFGLSPSKVYVKKISIDNIHAAVLNDTDESTVVKSLQHKLLNSSEKPAAEMSRITGIEKNKTIVKSRVNFLSVLEDTGHDKQINVAKKHTAKISKSYRNEKNQTVVTSSIQDASCDDMENSTEDKAQISDNSTSRSGSRKKSNTKKVSHRTDPESDVEIIEEPIDVIDLDEFEENEVSRQDVELMKKYGVRDISVPLDPVKYNKVKVASVEDLAFKTHEPDIIASPDNSDKNGVDKRNIEVKRKGKQRILKKLERKTSSQKQTSQQISANTSVKSLDNLSSVEMETLLKKCGMGITVPSPGLKSSSVGEAIETSVKGDQSSTRPKRKERSLSPQSSTSNVSKGKRRRNAKDDLLDQELILKYNLKEPKVHVKSLSKIEIALLKNPHSPSGKNDWLNHKFDSDNDDVEIEWDISSPLVEKTSIEQHKDLVKKGKSISQNETPSKHKNSELKPDFSKMECLSENSSSISHENISKQYNLVELKVVVKPVDDCSMTQVPNSKEKSKSSKICQASDCTLAKKYDLSLLKLPDGERGHKKSNKEIYNAAFNESNWSHSSCRINAVKSINTDKKKQGKALKSVEKDKKLFSQNGKGHSGSVNVAQKDENRQSRSAKSPGQVGRRMSSSVRLYDQSKLRQDNVSKLKNVECQDNNVNEGRTLRKMPRSVCPNEKKYSKSVDKHEKVEDNIVRSVMEDKKQCSITKLAGQTHSEKSPVEKRQSKRLNIVDLDEVTDTIELEDKREGTLESSARSSGKKRTKITHTLQKCLDTDGYEDHHKKGMHNRQRSLFIKEKDNPSRKRKNKDLNPEVEKSAKQNVSPEVNTMENKGRSLRNTRNKAKQNQHGISTYQNETEELDCDNEVVLLDDIVECRPPKRKRNTSESFEQPKSKSRSSSALKSKTNIKRKGAEKHTSVPEVIEIEADPRDAREDDSEDNTANRRLRRNVKDKRRERTGSGNKDIDLLEEIDENSPEQGELNTSKCNEKRKSRSLPNTTLICKKTKRKSSRQKHNLVPEVIEIVDSPEKGKKSITRDQKENKVGKNVEDKLKEKSVSVSQEKTKVFDMMKHSSSSSCQKVLFGKDNNKLLENVCTKQLKVVLTDIAKERKASSNLGGLMKKHYDSKEIDKTVIEAESSQNVEVSNEFDGNSDMIVEVSAIDDTIDNNRDKNGLQTSEVVGISDITTVAEDTDISNKTSDGDKRISGKIANEDIETSCKIVAEDTELSNKAVDIAKDMELSNKTVDIAEDMVSNKAVDIAEDMELSNKAVNSAEDMELSNKAVDIAEDMELSNKAVDIAEEMELSNKTVAKETDVSNKTVTVHSNVAQSINMNDIESLEDIAESSTNLTDSIRTIDRDERLGSKGGTDLVSEQSIPIEIENAEVLEASKGADGKHKNVKESDDDMSSETALTKNSVNDKDCIC